MRADEHMTLDLNISTFHFGGQTNAFLVRVCAMDRDKGCNVAVIADLDPRALGVYFRQSAYVDAFADFRLTDYPHQRMKSICRKRGQPSKPLLENRATGFVRHVRISPSDRCSHPIGVQSMGITATDFRSGRRSRRTNPVAGLAEGFHARRMRQ